MTSPTALPSVLTYGRFKGEFLKAVTDTDADTDLLPDRVPATGSVTLTPTVTSVKLVAEKITMFLKPITFKLDKDTGIFDGFALATDCLAMNPHNWNYVVSAAIDGEQLDTFALDLPTGAVKDYSTASPVLESNGVFITQGEPGLVLNSWLGEWMAGFSYPPGSITRSGNSSYIALEQNIDDDPALNSGAWDLFARGA